MAIWEGYLVGLAMVVFLGPVFFTLLQVTLEHGYKFGFAIVWGILISDVVVVALCFLGASDLFSSTENQFWIALLGSFVLFALGLKYIIKPDLNTNTSLKVSAVSLSAYFIKGFLVNFVNPFVFIVWISTITYAESKYPEGDSALFFLIAALLGILTIDSIKVLISNKLKPFLKGVFLRRIFFIIGLILIAFGVRLLYFCFK